jgi:hypothetical protein
MFLVIAGTIIRFVRSHKRLANCEWRNRSQPHDGPGRHRIGSPAARGLFGQECWSEYGQIHRLYAPALLWFDKDFCWAERWFVAGTEISKEVAEWVEDNGLNPNWRRWTTATKAIWRLRFQP